MSELALIYQTEPGRATPRLKPLNGATVPWAEDELLELEAELARQYPDLIRGKVDTVTFQDRPLQVTVKHEGGGRMPAVLLTSRHAAAPEGSPLGAPSWLEGLLEEAKGLEMRAGKSGLDPLERAMLKYAADELREMVGRVGADGVAGLLVAGHLAAAEHTARPCDPDRATVYAVALRGLEKLLAGAGADEAGMPFGRTSPGSGERPAPRPRAVTRLMRRLLGLPSEPTSPAQ